MLVLSDLVGCSEEQVIEHIISSYSADEEFVRKFQVLIAYESVGNWGCDSNSFFLLREKETGKLFENHGSHCSCYGFEGQFTPGETSLKYLKSENFYFSCGGYEDDYDGCNGAVKKFIAEMAD